METKQRDKRPVIAPGMPLSDKQITQGFRISGGIEGVLTRLFNIICLDVTGGRGISPIQWNKLMIDYIRGVIESNATLDRSSIRGNVNKELRRPSMTWNVFTLKGMKFLQFEAFTVSVYGDLVDGREFNAYTSISFVPNSKFEHLFPKELPCPPAVQRNDTKGRRPFHRTYANGASGVLAKLFNLISLSVTEGKGFSQNQWSDMLDAFIERTEGHRQLTVDKRQSIRGNLNKEFRLPKMTWKVFCKGLRFLEVAGFTIHITAYRKDNTISECETSINFAQRK
ncbi:hypothetical protein [Ralstonia phage RP31]|uniref:Uncharacterized protein n=1 Tax=Ralstonia phage RP31 TaxID=1923890 RepID=A0A1L7N1F5_9CAUD|nr:hypothetical protein [Ralstonia phage RP31]